MEYLFHLHGAEVAMHDDERFSNLPRVTALHPVVTGALAGSVAWTVGTLWLLFAGDKETMLQLAVVTGFAVAFVATPVWLWRLSVAGKTRARHLPFSEWRHARFEIPGGSVAGGEAALLVLLAPLACALGLTAVSVLRLVAIAVGA